MRRFRLAVVLLAATTILTACNGSPSAPSAMAGITINGSLVSPGGAGTAGSTLSSPGPSVSIPSGLTVSVVGTNISVVVDPSGQFVLRDVPAGTIELRFTGTGVSATVTLSNVQSGQSITIAVSVSNSSASVESERRARGSEEQLEGRVESLPPTTPALTLVVAGRTVTTDANTQLFLHGAAVAFSALDIGQRVHVSGTTSGGSLLARTVQIQNTNVNTGVEINGVVSNFSGTSAAFQFDVAGRTVQGDAATAFFGNSAFADLADGVSVEVKGSQRDGFVYAVRLHVEVQEDEVALTGVIGSITGTAPDLTLGVGTTTVTTSASTVVRRKGDTQSPASLQVGQTVEVSGNQLTTGTVAAKHINIKADPIGGQFTMTGNIGGLSGSCPTVSFSVSGFSIVTSVSTTFDPSCSALSNGTHVEVKGVVLSNGAISATHVEKK